MFEYSFKQITDTEKKIVTRRHHQWKENKCKYSFFVLDTNIFISPLFNGR